MNRGKILIITVFVAFLATSCSSYQKLLKSTDNELKYTKALEYYENGKYLKTQQLLDQIQPFFRGTDKAEKIAYYTAYTYYKQRDYILAGYYFKNFTNNFSSSPLSEETAYMSAYCNYLESPRSSLDQTTSKEAIEALEVFKSQYPSSTRIDDCNKLIAELHSKLEDKDINIAMMYYRMADYKAAIVSFKNVLKDYPDSKQKELILFSMLQTRYEYAINSIIEKKQERLQDALATYDELMESFPTGAYVEKAKAIKRLLDNEITN